MRSMWKFRDVWCFSKRRTCDVTYQRKQNGDKTRPISLRRSAKFTVKKRYVRDALNAPAKPNGKTRDGRLSARAVLSINDRSNFAPFANSYSTLLLSGRCNGSLSFVDRYSYNVCFDKSRNGYCSFMYHRAVESRENWKNGQRLTRASLFVSNRLSLSGVSSEPLRTSCGFVLVAADTYESRVFLNYNGSTLLDIRFVSVWWKHQAFRRDISALADNENCLINRATSRDSPESFSRAVTFSRS